MSDKLKKLEEIIDMVKELYPELEVVAIDSVEDPSQLGFLTRQSAEDAIGAMLTEQDLQIEFDPDFEDDDEDGNGGLLQ